MDASAGLMSTKSALLVLYQEKHKHKHKTLNN